MNLGKTLGIFGIALLPFLTPISYGSNGTVQTEAEKACELRLVRGADTSTAFQPDQFEAHVRALVTSPGDVATLQNYVNLQIAQLLHQTLALPHEEIAARMKVLLHEAMSKVGYLPGLSPRSAHINSLDQMIFDFTKDYGGVLGNVWANVIVSPQLDHNSLADGDIDFFVENLDSFACRLEAVAIWEVVRRQVSRGRWTYFESPTVKAAYEAVRLRSDFAKNPLRGRDRIQSLFPNDEK